MDMEDGMVSILSQGFHYCLKQGVTGYWAVNFPCTWSLMEHLLSYSLDLLCSYTIYLRISTKCFMAGVVNP